MDLSEYREWHEDLSAKLPQIAAMVKALPADTKRSWFADHFAMFELVDCVAANSQLALDPPTRVDRLPAKIAQLAQKARWKRLHEGETSRIDTTGPKDLVRSTGGGSADALDASREFRTRVRKSCPDCTKWHLCDTHNAEHKKLISDIIDKHSPGEDNEPRYKCLDCRDSGMLTRIDDKHRQYTLACHCEAGERYPNIRRARVLHYAEFDEWNNS